ncbi:PREDICTED: uncharacterized protein LOC109156664 [Ipomoea nil]|uniref:uncharacterized protein LOC109156664 n=1 Tax=Ipomoea nil TaxID=35883 RepID=UPI0009011781|nr:PREDICTED: uncharacterized protein LOC109156664 [Ipomoea nil]
MALFHARRPPFSALRQPATVAVANPAYDAWVKQDQTIVSLLVSSMADEVLHLALGRDTSAAIWTSITGALGSSSQARCLTLLSQIQMLRQGNATTADYLGRAGILVEALIQASRPPTLMEQNLYVIRGLRPELKALATSLTATGAALTLTHLSDFLQAHEFILVDDYPSLDTGVAHTAMYARTGWGSHGGGRQQQSSQQQRGGWPGCGGQHRGGRGGRGTPRCQICRSHGHSAIYCYKRYTTQPPQPQAHVATSGEAPAPPSTVPGDGWYPDTGATAHATPDPSMLSQSDEYGGSDVLRVGNGAGLSISRIGRATIPSLSKPFCLNNILHVPILSVPLLSVNKFAIDNNVFFEFHANYFTVKDSTTNTILLKGPTAGGLYKLPVSRQNFAFVSSRATPTTWHRRL